MTRQPFHSSSENPASEPEAASCSHNHLHAARPSRLNHVLIAPFILLIRLYQLTLSPWIGGHCRFTPTCSAYAIEAYRLHGPIKGTWLTLWRLCRCQPLVRGGYDPPPLPRDHSKP